MPVSDSDSSFFAASSDPPRSIFFRHLSPFSLITRGVHGWRPRQRSPRCFSRSRSLTPSIVCLLNRSHLLHCPLGRSRSPLLATLQISLQRNCGSWPNDGPVNMVCHLLLSLHVAPRADSISWAGRITYLHVLGQGLVFLNTPEVAFDLLDKRGAIYSDKPRLVMAGELYVCRNSMTRHLLRMSSVDQLWMRQHGGVYSIR